MRFYVYHLTSGAETVYVGKGSGRRLKNQMARTSLFGEILRRFKTEREAYQNEVRLIRKLKPPLNQNRGGGGPMTVRRAARKPKWVREIEAIGTRVYTARALLKFDLTKHCSAETIEKIRCVASKA